MPHILPNIIIVIFFFMLKTIIIKMKGKKKLEILLPVSTIKEKYNNKFEQIIKKKGTLQL